MSPGMTGELPSVCFDSICYFFCFFTFFIIIKIRIGDASLESIQKDTEKWLSYVAPLVGGTDTIIFAHGQDLADWHDYSSDNAKFAYLKSQGFNFFCNVDSSHSLS